MALVPAWWWIGTHFYPRLTGNEEEHFVLLLDWRSEEIEEEDGVVGEGTVDGVAPFPAWGLEPGAGAAARRHPTLQIVSLISFITMSSSESSLNVCR